jgi:hypothetical protein
MYVTTGDRLGLVDYFSFVLRLYVIYFSNGLAFSYAIRIDYHPSFVLMVTTAYIDSVLLCVV